MRIYENLGSSEIVETGHDPQFDPALSRIAFFPSSRRNLEPASANPPDELIIAARIANYVAGVFARRLVARLPPSGQIEASECIHKPVYLGQKRARGRVCKRLKPACRSVGGLFWSTTAFNNSSASRTCRAATIASLQWLRSSRDLLAGCSIVSRLLSELSLFDARNLARRSVTQLRVDSVSFAAETLRALLFEVCKLWSCNGV